MLDKRAEGVTLVYTKLLDEYVQLAKKTLLDAGVASAIG